MSYVAPPAGGPPAQEPGGKQGKPIPLSGIGTAPGDFAPLNHGEF